MRKNMNLMTDKKYLAFVKLSELTVGSIVIANEDIYEVVPVEDLEGIMYDEDHDIDQLTCDYYNLFEKHRRGMMSDEDFDPFKELYNRKEWAYKLSEWHKLKGGKNND